MGHSAPLRSSQQHQPLRVFYRQRAQQHCIEQAEDRRIRANPERQ